MINIKRFSALPILLLLFFIAIKANAQEQRTWTSNNGAFEKQGKLVEAKTDIVVLQLEDGKAIEVPIKKLSRNDQRYIASYRDSQTKTQKQAQVADVDPIVNLEGTKLSSEIEKRILEFHGGQQSSGEVLRVVYFHGSDSQPQADYEARLDRVLADIQDFYYQQMKQNGFKSARKLPLELNDGKLVVHTVAGGKPTRSYSRDMRGAKGIRDECKLALRKEIDFKSDYVLIVCGLVEKRGEKYFFNAPGYAMPCNHNFGCCFVPDCDKFDPKFFTNNDSKVSFSTQGKDSVTTLAQFNTQKVGHTAHELGHALNTPHNSQKKADLARKRQALMGYGNNSYRKEFWKRNSKGAFLTPATSTIFAIHPLFTGSDKARWKKTQCKFKKVSFSMKGRRFIIEGVVKSQIPAVAVIAYVDPAEGRDYDATSWVRGVGRDGSFQIEIDEHLPGPHDLRLAVLLANGATEVPLAVQYKANSKGVPDVKWLNGRQSLGPIESLLAFGKNEEASEAAQELLDSLNDSKEKSSDKLLRQLQHVIALSNPEEPRSLARVEEDSIYLSDVLWESANAGSGQPARNRMFVDPAKAAQNKRGVLLQVGGDFHEKGLYGHANSKFVFDLNGKWSEFSCVAGLHASSIGQVRFIIKGDGRELYRSENFIGSESEEVKLNVKGVRKLELIAESSRTSMKGCTTTWASPLLKR